MDDVQLPFPEEVIISKIHYFRSKKVMLDHDLSELYQVETKQLKRAVRRNILRFPDDFMFELSEEEFDILRSQIGTSRWGGIRYLPMAFTEQGVAMLSSVLNSSRAISVNIQIIRIFTKMRELLSSQKEILQKLDMIEKKEIEQDEKISLVFKYLKQLEKVRQDEVKHKNRQRVGFKQNRHDK